MRKWSAQPTGNGKRIIIIIITTLLLFRMSASNSEKKKRRKIFFSLFCSTFLLCKNEKERETERV
jgi:hypothetical protein